MSRGPCPTTPGPLVIGPWCAIRDTLSLVSCVRTTVLGPLISMAGATLREPPTSIVPGQELDLVQRDPTLVRRQEYVGRNVG